MEKGLCECRHMIEIHHASTEMIPIIESILLEAVAWMDGIGQPLWGEDEVRWPRLNRNFEASDFYVAHVAGVHAGCMALVDSDEVVWPGIASGESLFIHKLAVTRRAAGTGVSEALIERAKEICRECGIPALRLDCAQGRPKLYAFYERCGFRFVDADVLFGKFPLYRYQVLLP